MTIACFFLISTLIFVNGNFRLIFKSTSHPPHLISKDSNSLYYSVPLNQMISKPIIVLLVYINGTRVTTGEVLRSNATINSYAVLPVGLINDKDTWADSGGKLCQNSAWWLNYPERFNRLTAKTRCHSPLSSDLMKSPIFNGVIIFDWIYHKHTIVPSSKRLLRIKIPDYKLSIDTYPISVTKPAHRLIITKQPPPTILANHDFDVEVEIRDEEGKVLESGLDSVAYVEMTVPYNYKLFYADPEREMLVASSTIRLQGVNAILSLRTRDMVIRRKAKAGKAKFIGIRILDVVDNLQLNITLTMSRDPWGRIPPCSECFLDIERAKRLSNDSKFITFHRLPPKVEEKILPIAFTHTFRVEAQSVYKLVAEGSTKKAYAQQKDSQTNLIEVPISCPLLNGLNIIALDSSDRRIFSGPDSKSFLAIKTDPEDICLSTDYTKLLDEGEANVLVSICEVVSSVKLRLFPSGKISAFHLTPAFRIIGNITIGHVGDLRFSGDGSEIDSHINSFIQFAINDVNKGILVPKLRQKGINFRLKSYNIPDQQPTIYRTLGEFKNMLTNIRLVISSVTGSVAKALNPFLVKFMIPFISTIDTTKELSDKHLYPFYNRICWSEEEIWNSVFQSAKDRYWTDILIIRYYDVSFSDIFHSMAVKHSININQRIVIKQLDNLSPKYLYDGILHKVMLQVKKSNLKIIFLFVPFYIQPIVFREAYLTNISSVHGFQWVLVGKYAREFPFENQSVCSRKLECTLAFSGTYLFDQTYNVSGYQTETWKRVLNYYFKEDRVLYKGGRVRYRSFEVGALMGLGYDAVHLYAKALSILIERRLTFSVNIINWLLRTSSIDGLTDKVTLNAYGDRVGYFGYMAQINPIPRWPYLPKSKVISYVKCIRKREDGIQLEIPYESKILSRNKTTADVVFPVSDIYNTRRYISLSGMVGLNTQTMMPAKDEVWPPIIFIRTETVIAPYNCMHTCGTKLKDPGNINAYDRGRCLPGDKCECFDGFTGTRCHAIVCQCLNGHCVKEGVCICKPGYTGVTCEQPMCDHCRFGICAKPNVCECTTSLYIGRYCDIHIMSVLIPIFVGGIILVGLLYFSIIILSQKNNTQSNKEWLIEWNTVMLPERVVMVGQHAGIINKKIEVYEWKEQNWYMKKINSKTIPSDDRKIISDMIKLTKARHYNLIQYGGCCLTHPNVCLFVEIADKGSVSDILANETFEIGWEFGFSFLKDICCGMEFLHDKSDIKSHGRLKSTNCLVDKRWTVRLSGFGAPSLRYGSYRFAESDEIPKLKDLFWTAPELLGDNTSLDCIKYGTPQGDVYSFSIISCEIATKASPYNYELKHLNEKSIIDLIKNTTTPANKDIRRVWESIGGGKMIFTRPILNEELLPNSKLSRKLFQKMLEESWNERASSRPTFSKIKIILNQMHPIKGELIDKLIHLLETYSNNLEVIVVERTKELEQNKAKGEQLLSQMLPMKVANELKQGSEVMPELFECATVFFSDIVNFGRICRESKPIQIVDFLNEVYNIFDAVLDDYDVYKVETISDSYMVVSGIPERNGERHVGEIATMALDLMSRVTGLKISHMASNALQLRIGIHSGPVVTGVVGKLMPRFCLFGDTVNTASRMQSSSYALRIQVSECTAVLLVALGGYKLECRGKREVKGRGIMTTYWLWGKDTFMKELPDLSLAVPLSEHKFK